MAGIGEGGGIVYCGFLFDVRGIVFMINGTHLFVVQNTIFQQKSGVPMRMVNNQGLIQTEKKVLIRK